MPCASCMTPALSWDGRDWVSLAELERPLLDTFELLLIDLEASVGITMVSHRSSLADEGMPLHSRNTS